MGTRPNNIYNSRNLTETEIETLLSQVNPRPSSRFYKKIETAPWNKAAYQKRGAQSITSKPIRVWMLGLVVISFFLFIFGISFFPSVRAIAHQIAYSFFSSPSDQIEVQVTSSTDEELFHYSDPNNFTQTIGDVQAKAGFGVKEINQRPETLKLIGARIEPDYNSVTILYQAQDYSLFLTQRPIGKGKDIFSIGSNAQIHLVNIGDHQGEFVIGGWKAISTQTIKISGTPESQTNISAFWDDQLPQYTLRWQENSFVYEIRALGEGSPSQSDLIEYAIGLK
jgi:hypothetical protein